MNNADTIETPTLRRQEALLASLQPKRTLDLSERFRQIDDTTIEVIFGEKPTLPPCFDPLRDDRYDRPYDDGMHKCLVGERILKRVDEQLFIGDQEITAVVDSTQQQEGGTRADSLWTKQRPRSVHPDIVDVLIEHPHMVPRHLVRNKAGDPVILIFGGIAFLNQDNGLGLRGLWMDREGRLRQINASLHNMLDARYPFAILS